MIHVIIPSYNAPVEVARAIDSVNMQEYRDFHIIVVDDASPDPRHAEEAQHRCDVHGWTFIRNELNMKAPYTIKQGIEASEAEENDIIFLLDGDDFLPPWALGEIAKVYSDYPQMWMTYGNYQPHPQRWEDTGCHPAEEYPTLVRLRRTFRQYGKQLFNHPLTFKRFLWDQILDADLQFEDGSWYRDSYDQALMYPMLEMSAPDHYACLHQMLYYYNANNDLSEAILTSQGLFQAKAGQVILQGSRKDQLFR